MRAWSSRTSRYGSHSMSEVTEALSSNQPAFVRLFGRVVK